MKSNYPYFILVALPCYLIFCGINYHTFLQKISEPQRHFEIYADSVEIVRKNGNDSIFKFTDSINVVTQALHQQHNYVASLGLQVAIIDYSTQVDTKVLTEKLKFLKVMDSCNVVILEAKKDVMRWNVVAYLTEAPYF